MSFGFYKKILKVVLSVTLICLPMFFFSYDNPRKSSGIEGFKTPQVFAENMYAPYGNQLVVGTEQNVTAVTAAAAEGVNNGSWKGLGWDDNYHWQVAGTSPGGVDAQVVMGGVELNGANALSIQTEFDLDATALSTVVQICDWVSSTNVDNAADARCTTGGWRTLNNQGTAITTTTATTYAWLVYDGFWNASGGSNTATSTPLANFVNGSSEIRIRFYSTTSTTSTISIDYVRVQPSIYPFYAASGAVNLGSGTVTGDYRMTNNILQGASDNTRLQVAGTAGSIADFYLKFQGVQTYTGMNTILFRAEYSCDNTGINLKPKIYNFNSSSWEDLTTATIACSTTDTSPMAVFAKNNVTISNYISSGEVRVGFYGSGNSTVAIRVDYAYIMLGTTNTSTAAADCFIPFGTNNAGTCANTRDIDTPATASTWDILSEDESSNLGHSFFPGDTDIDTTTEEAASAHIKFSVTGPDNGTILGHFFAGKYTRGTGGTITPSLFDYAAYTGTQTNVEYGGFYDMNYNILGTSQTVYDNASATSTYYDAIIAAQTAGQQIFSLGFYGGIDLSMVDTTDNEMWARIRTKSAGATTNNTVSAIDFAMVSYSWIEKTDTPFSQTIWSASGNQLVTGTEQNVTAITAPATEGVNVGSWYGLADDDNYHWQVAGTSPGGVNAQVIVDDVKLNGANALLIQTEFDLDATALSTDVQICDWVSSTNVDSAADSQCTTGGWRNLNNLGTDISTATPTAYNWLIYDGFWNASGGSNTATSTPLTNFVNGSNQIRVRYYSTTSTTSTISIDYLRVDPEIFPVYAPSGAVNLGSGTVTGDYRNTNNILQGSSDNTRLQVAGTAGSIADFYLKFQNVETYTGMNTILFRAEYSCSNTGINLKPKIYNFNSSSWEDLTTATIACSTTDTSPMAVFAKNNVTISDYISSGEVRVGFYGSGNSTVAIRVDYAYIMLGTTNTSTAAADCFISFGSNSAGTCANTRDIDTPATASTWDILTEDESSNLGHDYFFGDNDADAVTEEAAASHVRMTVTKNSGSKVTHGFFASRHMSGAAGTVSPSIYLNNVGFFNTPATSTSTTALTYADTITSSDFSAASFRMYAHTYLNINTSQMWTRLRTTSAGATTNNSVNQWDFIMASISWVEPTITVSGVVYKADETTTATNGNGGSCDGSTANLSLSVNGGTAVTTSCSSSTGAFTFSNVSAVSGDTITIFSTATDKANTVYISDGTNDTGINLYYDTVALGHQTAGPVTILDILDYDNDQSSTNMLFDAEDSSPDTLVVENGVELHIETGMTFTPGGTVTTDPSGSSSTKDGDIHIDGTGVMTMGTNALSVGGDFTNEGTFNKTASQTTTFTATSTGHVITDGGENFDNVTFNGASGGWSFADSTTVDTDLTVTDGTLSGTNDITVNGGDVTGNGTITLTGGTFLVNTAGSFGGNTAWTFYNLTIGAAGNATTTATGSGGVTVSTLLTIDSGDTLDAKGKTWTLSGTGGTVLTISGTLNDSTDTSTFAFTGNNGSGNTTIPASTAYHNITVNNSSETYVLAGTTTGDSTGTLTITDGTLSTTGSNYALTIGAISIANSASAILTANASVITLNATSGTLFTRGSSGAFTQGTSEVVISPASGTGITLLSAATTFHKLTINTSASVINAGAAITMSNANASNKLYVQAGVLNDGGNTIVGTSNGTLEVAASAGLCISGTASGTSATCDSGATPTTASTFPTNYTNGNITLSTTSTVYYLADDAQTISATPTYGILKLSPKITASRVYTMGGALTINGNFQIVPSASSAYTLRVDMAGHITVASTKTTTITSELSALSILDTRPSATDYNLTSGAIIIDSNGTLDATGAASVIQLTATSGDLFTNNATFTSGSSTVKIAVDAAPSNLFAGTFTGASSLYNLEFSPVLTGNYTYAGGAAITVSNNFSILPTGIRDLVYEMGGANTVTGTLLIQPGAGFATVDTSNGNNYDLSVGNMDIESQGIVLANNSAITVSTNWTNLGTFTAGNSTVTFNTGNTATVSGPTTFYNLTITHTSAKEVDFSDDVSHIIDVTNEFTVTGHALNLIKLYSTVSTSKWHFNPTGTATVDYADVMDGGCEGTAITINTTNSNDSGNNESCWVFQSPSITFAISDNTVGFGTLSSSAFRCATGDGTGSASEVEAHNMTVNTNASSGYSLSVNGTTLTSGGNTIDAIGSTNTASSVGTEQFGLRMTATGGVGSVSSPYAASGFAFDTGSLPDEVASATSGNGVTTTYSVRYLGNISGATEPGSYTSTLTYIVTGNF